MKLIIVESPAKCKKIESFLGSDYNVLASFGHIMDLDPNNLSVDVDNNFEPNYIIMNDKKKVVSNLVYHAKNATEIILASDDDKEGEAISWSLMKVLKLNNPNRIVFNEITKKAIINAVENPTKINMNKVYSQQARRILDRLMGYKISPILMKHLQGKLSAGRVQSVVVRIIIDMENHIKNSMDNTCFYKSIGNFKINNIDIKAQLMLNNEYYKIENKETAIKLLESIKNATVIIKDNIIKESKKNPPPPHITSTLMQEASTKLGYSSKKTMEVAQKLYENGYITYMRTDSIIISNDGVNMIKNFIENKYGKEYYTFRKYNNKDTHAQEAHECIRPTDVNVEYIEDESMNKLYILIWKRTLASLMSPAVFDVQTIYIDMIKLKNSILPDNSNYISTIEQLKFEGYLVLYDNKYEDKLIDKISKISIIDINMNESFKELPLRYNEAGLIKYLKKEGIGRPSTYASIISKIIDRNYVEIKNIDGVEKKVNIIQLKNDSIIFSEKNINIGSEKQKLIPTELGLTVNDFMMKHFDKVMDISFTADMEKKLDLIESGEIKWFNVIKYYYELFNPVVEKLNINNIIIKNDDKCLGEDNNVNIYLTKSKYGWCVKKTIDGNTVYASLDCDHKDITLEKAIVLLSYPKDIGKIGNMNVSLCKGKYGLYFKIGSKMVGIKTDISNMSNEELISLAKELNNDSNTFIIGKTKVYVKNGDNGPYLMLPHGTKKPTFISIPKNIDHTNITATQIKEIIEKNKKFKKQV